MYHQGTVKGSVVRAVSLLAGASIFGVAGLATSAGASTAVASPVGSGPVDYSCSLAPYGQSLAPLSLVAGLSADSNGSAVTVKLTTQPVQLPAATAAALPQLSYLDVAGSATASGMSGTAVSLAGQSAYQGAAAGGMTQLPAITAVGTTSPSSPASARVQVPQTIMLTPVGATAKAPLTCTTASTTTVQVAVGTTGTSGAVGAAGTGQPYTCTITVGSTSTTASRVPMRLTATRMGTVGSQDAVTLSAPVSELGSAFPASAAPMSVTGSAPLGGTYAGTIPMTGLADSGDGSFQLTGHWMPQSPGNVRIFAPHRFAASLREQTATMVTVACTATSATTTSTQVKVKVSRSSAAAVASASASTAPAAAPGAPNTGGGGSLHSASELPLAAGGAAMVVAGLAITGYAVKRRRGFNH